METFVLRVFVPASGERLPLTGIVEHVGSGRATTFQGPDDLVQLVLQELELDDPPQRESDEAL